MNFSTRCFGFCVAALLASCQYFTSERISSETFYKEEMESIDWNEVDTYPAFKECETFTEKAEQKNCFQSVLQNRIKAKLDGEKVMVSQSVSDTVNMILQIEKEGNIQVVEIITDSLTLQHIPLLSQLLKESVEQLPAPAPAYKRGIPVTTQVTLPIVLNSPEL
ncbi:MAG: hypothetical protein R2793_02260 [Flavobacteriaceae bacterium]